MMTRRFTSLAAAFVLVLFAGHAFAGEPRALTKYADWDTFIYMEGDHKVCYMTGAIKLPEELKDKPNQRHAYAIITDRPADGTRNVFSYVAGYTYKKGSEVTVTIDNQKFVLFTQDDTAWAPDADTDNKLAKAITAGKSMTIAGTSDAGKKTVDTLSLEGSSSAHDAIDKECY